MILTWWFPDCLPINSGQWIDWMMGNSIRGALGGVVAAIKNRMGSSVWLIATCCLAYYWEFTKITSLALCEGNPPLICGFSLRVIWSGVLVTGISLFGVWLIVVNHILFNLYMLIWFEEMYLHSVTIFYVEMGKVIEIYLCGRQRPVTSGFQTQRVSNDWMFLFVVSLNKYLFKQ